MLGIQCIFSIDGGKNDGHVHFNMKKVSEYGKMLVADVARYWKTAQEVIYMFLRVKDMVGGDFSYCINYILS